MISFLLIPWCTQGIFLPFLRLHSTFRNPLGHVDPPQPYLHFPSFVRSCFLVDLKYLRVPMESSSPFSLHYSQVFIWTAWVTVLFPFFFCYNGHFVASLHNKVAPIVFDPIFLFNNNYNEKGMRISLIIFFITIYSKYKSI